MSSINNLDTDFKTLHINDTHLQDVTINRLNYIGSKYLLFDWIFNHILSITKWNSLENKHIADLFSGTGFVSYYFRKNKAIVTSNDAELYSYYITHAYTCSIYTDNCHSIIKMLNDEINEQKYINFIGFITRMYSPYHNNTRMFFTLDNAKRIDYIRNRIEELKTTLNDDEYKFLLASLIFSADSISNVPAVYGCYLKKFKPKSLKNMKLIPIHTIKDTKINGSITYNKDAITLAQNLDKVDLVYLDPPYNERQYSKNYFPLNIIALTPTEQNNLPPLKGITGIPQNCFISTFCKKNETVKDSFDKLISSLNTEWIFISYNSESIIKKDDMINLLSKYGTVTLYQKDYKRFKSFSYNEDKSIDEYLFCLKLYDK
jgi:adenine-specific DNA-methyltransferase